LSVCSCLILVKLSVCLSVSLSVNQTVCQSVCLSVSLPACLHTKTHQRATTTTLNAQVDRAMKPQICIHAFGSAVQSDQDAAYHQSLWYQSPQQLLQQPLLQPASLPLLLP